MCIKNTTEYSIQASFIRWLSLQYPKLINTRKVFAIPNGGYFLRKNPKSNFCPEGTRLKRLGLTRGVGDIFVMIAKDCYHGLWIEIKTKTGKQTKEQMEFERSAKDENYLYKIARSLEEAIEIFNKYILTPEGNNEKPSKI